MLTIYVIDNFQIIFSIIPQMLTKFAEDDRIEQMNAQKRRMKQMEHKRAVERLIDERRGQLQKDMVRLFVFVVAAAVFVVVVVVVVVFVVVVFSIHL